MELDYTIRLAEVTDALVIWQIIQQGIQKRKEEGSTQWQDGYPNLEVIYTDITKKEGYVILNNCLDVVGYVVLSCANEPAYDALKLGWLTTNKPYLVVHRLAICQQPKIKGLAYWTLQQAEVLAQKLKIESIKVDTNYDNAPMIHLFKKLNYTYCGKVYFRGSERLAFEKLTKIS